MRAALVLALLLTAAPPPKAPPRTSVRRAAVADAGTDAPAKLALEPAKMGHFGSGEARCSACHVTTSWSDVRFNHNRTGFPLTGAHGSASCKGCHASDFERPVPSTCSGCHRDVHASDLGARCEGCHDTVTWASRFDADAHRRTAFPLVGGHAAIPCAGCHFEASGRRFSRAAVECTACHQADLDRTRGTSVDHALLDFTGSCRNCHHAFRFKPALFPTHDRCYVISSGSHAQTPCLGCHDPVAGFSKTTPGGCATRTAQCTRCHERFTASAAGARATEPLHQPPQVIVTVPGYAFSDRRCYECHKPLGAVP